MKKGKIADLDFEYTIEDSALDDYELVEVLCEIDDGKSHLVTKAFKLLLGDEQLSELKEIIRKKSGHVSLIEMMSVFSQIMEQNNETKK